MLDQTQMAANSLLYKINIFHIRKRNWSAVAGLKKSQKSIRQKGGTPHLDQRHTVFGQLMDEASFAVLDEIAAVETGMMDKPVEDVVIETIEIED